MKIFEARRTDAIRLAVIAALVSASFIYVGVVGGDVAVYGTQDNDLPIYNVATTQKKVAITFDAAWGADTTGAILDALAGEDVPATFFLVGFWIDRYPDQVRAIAAAGHEIGNHSNTHAHFNSLTAEGIQKEVLACSEKLSALTGKPVDLFRAPYGEYNASVIRTCRSLGLYVIQWDVDSLDWKGLSAAQMRERILTRVKPGSIILMHLGGEHTVEALPEILRGIKQMGYEFVTVSELIVKEDYWIDHAGMQHAN